MKLERLHLLDQLATSSERCLGAAFTTFTFESAFFENHVLAAVLRVSADPDEAAAAYHEEALSILQETPVVCFVDGTMRKSGHQLPYDLREIRHRCFHPKVALLLFETYARLSVGSANLTKQGYGRNAETVFVHDLYYSDASHAAVLRDVAGFFDSLDIVASPLEGKQTVAFLSTLRRRIADVPASDDDPEFRFIHTESETPLLEQILGMLPDNAVITRIGVLAPFFERDDATADPADEMASVLMELAKRAKNATLDLGVAWDDAPVAASGEVVAIAENFGSLWAERLEDDDGVESVRYFVPTAITAGSYRYVDDGGESRLSPRAEMDKRIAARTTWHVGRPRIYAPAKLVEVSRQHASDVKLYLHPGIQLHGGARIERPLHAKLLAIAFRSGSKRRTLVVIGSANASRVALLRTAASGGNVEACVAFQLDGEHGLQDLAPEIACCAMNPEWLERTFPEPPPMPTVPRPASAVFSPQPRTLTVTWQDDQPAIGAWTLKYQDAELFSGVGAPSGPTIVTPFVLAATSCEITLVAADGEITFPIVVDDLAALPLEGYQSALDLRDLLALVGRRLSPARHRFIASKHGPAMVDATLTSILGENFSPTDVLRVWWSVAHDLATPGVTVAGFRLRLLGTLSAGAVWRRIYELARDPESGMRPEEAWFYGSELRRALAEVVIPDDADRSAKVLVLDQFVAELATQLVVLQPSSEGRPWIAEIVGFYQPPVRDQV